MTNQAAAPALIRTLGGMLAQDPEEAAPPRHKLHAYADVAVVVVVLAGTNLIAHFTTALASIATVPIAAVVLLAMMRRRGLDWHELGLSPRHWRRGTLYAVGAVGVVLAAVAIGAALPITRPFFLADRYATISGALIASMIVIPLQTAIPEDWRSVGCCTARSIGSMARAGCSPRDHCFSACGISPPRSD